MYLGSVGSATTASAKLLVAHAGYTYTVSGLTVWGPPKKVVAIVSSYTSVVEVVVAMMTENSVNCESGNAVVSVWSMGPVIVVVEVISEVNMIVDVTTMVLILQGFL